MSENDSSSKHSLLFMGLVTSFQQSALQSLGKLVDPTTGKTEISLPSAAAYIDMLDMLVVKTQGNLSPEEASTLEEIVSHLKLNYVEELNKPKAETKTQPSPGEASDSKADDSAPPDDSTEKAES